MSLLWTEPRPPSSPARTGTVRVRVTETVEDSRDVERPDRDAAFTEFASARAPELLRVAWFLCGDAHRAEELVQETLVRTYTSWSRAAAGDTFAYSRRILVNLRTDTWRRRRRESLVAPDELPDVAVPDESGSMLDRDALAGALATLGERQRRVVLLRHLLGLSEAEVAAELGISVGTVKSTSSRGLAALRRTLAPDLVRDPTAAPTDAPTDGSVR